MPFNRNSDEKEISMMVKKVVHEVMKEIEFDLESLLESRPEEIEGLIFEKVFAILLKDPRHIDAVTTFGNEELENLEMN